MQYESPFAPVRTNEAGTSQRSHTQPNVSAHAARSEANARRFAQLKPTCVKLLSEVPSSARPETQTSIHTTLCTLSTKLDLFQRTSDAGPLSLALISYVFYPVAQLLRALSAPPDRIRGEAFHILSLLATDWWQAWRCKDDEEPLTGKTKVQEQWKVWEQLLIMAATTLTPRPGELSQHSDETTNAVLSLLYKLLAPRTSVQSILQPSSVTVAAAFERVTDWEWDGESDLPDMDDYEAEMEKIAKAADASKAEQAARRTRQVVYPSSKHLLHTYTSSTCRGVLAHVLTASLDLAKSSQRPTGLRSKSMQLAHILLHIWVAGTGDDDTGDGLSFPIEQSQLWDPSLSPALRTAAAFRPSARAERLSMYLPGVVSTLVRICTETKTAHADVLSEALRLLRTLLVGCLADDVRTSTVQGHQHAATESDEREVETLESLVAKAHLSDQTDEREGTAVPGVGEDVIQNRSTQNAEQETPSLSTMSRVAFALQAIGQLRLHPHAAVRSAVVVLAGDLLTHCSAKIRTEQEGKSADLKRVLLGWLIDGVVQRDSAQVAEKANDYIVKILSAQTKSRTEGIPFIVAETRDLMQQMPRLLTSIGQDSALSAASHRLGYLVRLASGDADSTFTRFDDLRTLLDASNGYERWSIGLLSSMTVDQVSTPLAAESDAAKIRLQGMEAETSRAVLDVFCELGAAAARSCQQKGQDGTSALSLAAHLMRLAAHWRFSSDKPAAALHNRHPMGLNALLIADRFVAGVARVMNDTALALLPGKDGSRLRKHARRFARTMIHDVLDMWQTDEDELLRGDLNNNADPVHALTKEERQMIQSQIDSPLAVAAEYRRGVEQEANGEAVEQESAPQLGPVVNVDFVRAATIVKGQPSRSTAVQANAATPQQVQARAVTQAGRRDALLLCILASCGKMMGTAMKPMLLQTIYPMVCAVASESEVVRGSAASALELISHAAGYASVQGCLLDHADYVLGAASHRLVSTLGQELQVRSGGGSLSSSAFATQDVQLRDSEAAASYSPLMSALSAPLVLVELIRMLGKEVVVLVEDAIDEVLDAIDRFHADQVICDGLLSVLDRMMAVLLEQTEAAVENSPPSALRTTRAENGFQPDNKRDFDDFAVWYRRFGRRSEAQRGDEEADQEAQNTAAEEAAPVEEPEADPTTTRSQQVTLSMLKKALPFVSHSSRTLRMRCLRLINRGVEVLCRQGLTAEPLSIIHNLWPILMGRLGFSLARPLPDLHRRPSSTRREADNMDESDFFVAVEAVKLLATLARYLVRYVGSDKMLRQAVPRLILLMRAVEQEEQWQAGTPFRPAEQTTFLLREKESDPTVRAASKSTALVNRAGFRPIRPHSPLAIIVEQALYTFDTLVASMGAQMTEADLFALVTEPTLVACLDTRQIMPLQDVSRRFFFVTLAKRNAALVWLVMRASSKKPKAEPYLSSPSTFPTFLARPELSLGITTTYL